MGLKSNDIRTTEVRKDCPFTREEIIEFKAMLYSVNAGNHCCNPGFISWAVGYQEHEQIQAMKGHRERYKEWLQKELDNLTKTEEE